MKKDNEKLLIYGGVALLAYFGIVKPIFNKLGITKSQEDRIIDTQTQLPNKLNPFSPEFFKLAPGGTPLLKRVIMDKYCKIIYDAFGFFSDDEAAIFSVFRSFKNQAQVSWLCEVFRQNYNTDLLEYLKRGYNQFNPASGLNSEELNTVLSIVNKLPKY